MECQVAQINWKPSTKWVLEYEEVLEQIIQNTSNVFKSKYGYNLHKGNSSILQVLAQSEIDLIGISFEENMELICAIVVDVNDEKVSDGTKEETTFIMIKKFIRTVMCMYGYFGSENGTIVLIAPKIKPSVINNITTYANVTK